MELIEDGSRGPIRGFALGEVADPIEEDATVAVGEVAVGALGGLGRLTMPVLGLGGESSFFVPIAKPMLKEIAKDTMVVGIPRCGHWVAEENPQAFVREVMAFTG